MSDLIKKLYHNSILSRIFHTLVYCLQRELKDCKSVLDLGCGPSSPLQYCKDIKYSVGVEAYAPYLNESSRKRIHTKYLNSKIEDLNFAEKSFDAVILIEVLEHLSPKIAIKILKMAKKWARKKIIVTTPNGFFPMGAVDKNPLQIHRSGWTINNFTKMGFKCYGMAGMKFFYLNKNQVSTMIDINGKNIFINIRFSPKRLFYILNSFMQIFTHYIPKLSFEIFAIKVIKNKIDEN